MTKADVIQQLAQAYADRRNADDNILRLEGALAVLNDMEKPPAPSEPDVPLP